MKKKRIIVNQKDQVISGIIIILNMKVMVIEISKILPEKHFSKYSKPYLRDIVIDLEKSDTWNNFISAKDTEEEHVMHSKSSNIKFESYSDRN